MLGWMACHSNCRDREAGNQFPFGPGRETADDRKRPSLEMVDTFDKLLLELERCLMGTSRRQFTDEFKRESVGLLASSGRPLSQIARELGIAASMLRSWRDAGDRGKAGSPQRSNTQAAIPPAGADLAAENARLRRENERLRMEREILKKTLRIFSEAPR